MTKTALSQSTTEARGSTDPSLLMQTMPVHDTTCHITRSRSPVMTRMCPDKSRSHSGSPVSTRRGPFKAWSLPSVAITMTLSRPTAWMTRRTQLLVSPPENVALTSDDRDHDPGVTSHDRLEYLRLV